MSEPTSAYSMQDLITRVAVELASAYYGSTGNEKAMPPVDNVHNLDLCKKIVNDGIKKFISDAPAKGWRWMRRIMAVTFASTRVTGTVDSVSGTAPGPYTFVDATLSTTYDADDDLNDWYVYILTGTGAGLYAKITDYVTATGTCTVTDWLDSNGNAIDRSGGVVPAADDTFAITNVETIEGDLARYPLPENFGGEVDGPIRYAKDTSHGGRLDWVDESYVRARRAVTVSTGYPRYATIRNFEPVNSAPSAKRRFELIVDPQPSAADTVEFPYTLFFDKLKLEGGSASAGGSTSLTDSTFVNIWPDDYFKGWTISIISGTGKGSYAKVTGSTGSTCAFAVADWLDINGGAGGVDPDATSIYVVEPTNNLHPAGFRFDRVILKACLAEMEQSAEEMVSTRHQEEYYKVTLPAAHKLDLRSAPLKLGNLLQREYTRERFYNDIVYNTG